MQARLYYLIGHMRARESAFRESHVAAQYLKRVVSCLQALNVLVADRSFSRRNFRQMAVAARISLYFAEFEAPVAGQGSVMEP